MRGVCARVRSHARNESNSRRFSPRKLASKSANGNVGPATTGSRIDRNVAEKRAKYARTTLLSPPPPAPSRTGCSQRGGSLSLTSSRHLAVTVGFDARTRCHPLDVTWTSVHANCRESTPMETSGNEPIDRFGASVLEQGGYVSIFNARIGKGFEWSIGDRTGQG